MAFFPVLYYQQQRQDNTEKREKIAVFSVESKSPVGHYVSFERRPAEKIGVCQYLAVAVYKARNTGVCRSDDRLPVLYGPEDTHAEVLVRTICPAEPGIVRNRNDKIAALSIEFSDKARECDFIAYWRTKTAEWGNSFYITVAWKIVTDTDDQLVYKEQYTSQWNVFTKRNHMNFIINI